ncbi:Sec-independent protein translocase subunit TatA [Streptomyces sp. NBC_01310]|uniref:Sec-independent protein translocase subunit TatA n=1 Tax=Streptomyces sp. NBC_01310 TaxID=2903820 RepID=UPI0035B5860E|nr:Sec-independent protein translocase subunit TatA [Streptomyces sp. NBC_01310]WSJ63699.1 Sec-independent protein translocase subunit TatA [Streptomyces sp. NBC_01310]
MFGKLGAPEIILILVVLVLLFGAKRLPGMARSVGQSLRILKSETKAMRDRDTEEDTTTAAASTPEIVEGTPLVAATASTPKIVSGSH